MNRTLPFLLLTFFLSIPLTVSAQKKVGVPDLEIQLLGSDGRGPRQTTSQDGTFSFNDLAEGTYRVYISPKQIEQATLLMPALMKAKEKANRTMSASTTSTAGAAGTGGTTDVPQASFSLNFTKIEMCYIKQDEKSGRRQSSSTTSSQNNDRRIFNWTGIFDENDAPMIVVDKGGGSLEGAVKCTYDLKSNVK